MPALLRIWMRTYCSTVPSWTAMVWPRSWEIFLMGEPFGTRIPNGDDLGFVPLVAATTFTGSLAAWAKMVGVSAMSPRSTDPPVSAAMIGGPPTNSLQLTSYFAPLSALVASKTVSYCLNWSAKLRVTPERLGVVEAAAAMVDEPDHPAVSARDAAVAASLASVRRMRSWVMLLLAG